MLATLALSACAAGGDPRDRLRAVAKPGEVVAAELAMARAMREDGSLEGATDFAASGVAAAQIAANAPRVARSQPRLILASCDGTLSVAKGEWQGADGGSGTYDTVWQRQSNGNYRWVMRLFQIGIPFAEPDDFIATRVASCDNLAAIPSRIAGAGAGASSDGTLRWRSSATADGTAKISVEMWDGATFEKAEQP